MKNGWLFFAAGLLNGLLGTGGGIVVLPVLYSLYTEPKDAHRWVNLVILPLTVISLISQDFLPDRFVLPLSIGALTGGIAGALLLERFSSELLRGIFAVLLFYSGVRCFF